MRFPKNFDAPYKAVDIVDFWRRWHISLSTWLRDYLYVPLGGNRHGRLRTYVHLMLTMLLGGLWHGASWTFVAWGGLHGLALSVTRAYREWRERAGGPLLPRRLGGVLGVFLTFHLVAAGWIFFRAESFEKARLIFDRLTSLTHYHPNLDARVLCVLGAGLAGHFLPERWYEGFRSGFCRLPAVAQAAVLFGALHVVRAMASAEAVPFVYFQF